LSGKPGLADRQQSYATNRPRQEVSFQRLLENKSRQSIGLIGCGAPSGAKGGVNLPTGVTPYAVDHQSAERL